MPCCKGIGVWETFVAVEQSLTPDVAPWAILMQCQIVWLSGPFHLDLVALWAILLFLQPSRKRANSATENVRLPEKQKITFFPCKIPFESASN